MTELHYERPATPKRSRISAIGTIPIGVLWAVLAIMMGLAIGIGLHTFRYAQGLSYLSTDPKACVNCHIMQPQYDGWQHGSHHAVAVCVDCHLPHSFIPKYFAKAENGWRHGEKFTTQNFVEPIRVQQAGSRILQDNCLRCHQSLVHDISSHGNAQDESLSKGTLIDEVGYANRNDESLTCVHCHQNVGHGPRALVGPPNKKPTPTPESL